MFEKLKKRWGISSNFQIAKIFIVFAITGSTSALITSPLKEFLGLSYDNLDWFLFWPLEIIIITLVYQPILLIVAAIFFEFKFFWEFEKKMLRKIGLKNLK
ncbi:MAG: DUF6787 family protein [Bacteroidota bacterium]|nr:DUF6787 family protein [Bacteroidota bacterium]